MLQGICLNSHVALVDNTSQDYENPSNPEPSVRIGTRHSSTPNVLLHDKDVNIKCIKCSKASFSA
jgi:hypothetical protein